MEKWCPLYVKMVEKYFRCWNVDFSKRKQKSFNLMTGQKQVIYEYCHSLYPPVDALNNHISAPQSVTTKLLSQLGLSVLPSEALSKSSSQGNEK